jgi:small-conductance mechanosensitive channel
MKALLLGALDGVPDVLPDPPADAIVVDLTDTALKIRLRWWIAPPSQFEMRTGLDVVLAAANEALRHERDRIARAGTTGRTDGSHDVPASSATVSRER